MITTKITDEQWQQFDEEGYLRLGKVMDDTEHQQLQERIDDIMLGTAPLDYEKMMMQLDTTTGKYKDLGAQTKGHKGSTLHYRKIQDLEEDPHYLAYMQKPLFQNLCAHVYGDETRVASFRAMFMNKPAGSGTFLPWHQDRWKTLDRDPLLTVWMALDSATIENGCVQVIPRSHKWGLINPDHGAGFLTEDQSVEAVKRSQPIHLELEAGEAVALHNWLLHSSDTNHSPIARRAFSVCYMDAATVDSSGKTYPVIFGEGAIG